MAARVPLNLPPVFVVDVEEGVLKTLGGQKFGVLAELTYHRDHNPAPPYRAERLGMVDDRLRIRVGFNGRDEAEIEVRLHKPSE